MRSFTTIGVKLKSEICETGPLKQYITVTNVPINKLNYERGRYNFFIKKNNKRQSLEIQLSFHKSIIEKKSNTKQSFLAVKFYGNNFDVIIERDFSIRKLKCKDNKYIIKYSSINHEKITCEVTNALEDDYYKSQLLPKIQEIKEKRKQKEKVKNPIPVKSEGNTIPEYSGVLPKNIKINQQKKKQKKTL